MDNNIEGEEGEEGEELLKKAMEENIYREERKKKERDKDNRAVLKTYKLKK